MRQGDYQEAQRHYGDGLVLARQLGDRESAIWSLLNLGIVTINLGDRNRAKAFFEEGFSLFRELGSKQGQAMCLYYFGYLAQFEGDNQAAMTFFKQELALARTTGPLWLGAQALFGLAAVAAASGRASQAARLFGAAEVRLEAGASYIDAADSLFNGRTSAKAIAILGEAVFAAARAEGRAMTFEQAADDALEEN